MSYDAFDGRILVSFTFDTSLREGFLQKFWPAYGPSCFLSWRWAFDGLFNKLQ